MNRPDLKTLSKEVYEANKAKGFHETIHSDKHHLCLIVSELMEAVEAHRKGRKANLENFYFCISRITENNFEIEYQHLFNTFIKDTVEDELADSVIRLLDFVGARHYSLNTIPININIAEKGIFTEIIWEVISRLVVNQSEEGVLSTISQVEEICSQMSINLWEHVKLKIKYNRMRPYKHDKKY